MEAGQQQEAGVLPDPGRKTSCQVTTRAEQEERYQTVMSHEIIQERGARPRHHRWDFFRPTDSCITGGTRPRGQITTDGTSPAGPGITHGTRAHSFVRFKKHTLLKACTQSPCFSYPGLARALKSAGSADLLSFGGDGVVWAPDLLCWLPAYNRGNMRPVYILIVSITDFSSFFVSNKCCSSFSVDSEIK
jgi:hypothetical protein